MLRTLVALVLCSVIFCAGARSQDATAQVKAKAPDLQAPGKVYVHGYYTRTGRYVSGHYRKTPIRKHLGRQGQPKRRDAYQKMRRNGQWDVVQRRATRPARPLKPMKASKPLKAAKALKPSRPARPPKIPKLA